MTVLPVRPPSSMSPGQASPSSPAPIHCYPTATRCQGLVPEKPLPGSLALLLRDGDGLPFPRPVHVPIPLSRCQVEDHSSSTVARLKQDTVQAPAAWPCHVWQCLASVLCDQPFYSGGGRSKSKLLSHVERCWYISRALAHPHVFVCKASMMVSQLLSPHLSSGPLAGEATLSEMINSASCLRQSHVFSPPFCDKTSAATERE